MCRPAYHDKEVLPPTIPSGPRPASSTIISGWAFNTLIFWAVHSYLSRNADRWNLRAAEDFCPTVAGGSCHRNDLLAFQIVSLVMLSYLGLSGFHTWSISGRTHRLLPDTPEGRAFGTTLGEADQINAAIVVFQGWNFVGSFFVEELRTGIMLTHHILAMVCGIFSLHYRIVPYYAVYFGGVTEFSSIFLVFVDIGKYFPPPPDSLWSKAEFFCQVAFLLTFFQYRVVGWIRETYRFLSDVQHLFQGGLVEKYRPGSSWFLVYLATCSVLLGALQIFWFGQIMTEAMKVL